MLQDMIAHEEGEAVVREAQMLYIFAGEMDVRAQVVRRHDRITYQPVEVTRQRPLRGKDEA